MKFSQLWSLFFTDNLNFLEQELVNLRTQLGEKVWQIIFGSFLANLSLEDFSFCVCVFFLQVFHQNYNLGLLVPHLWTILEPARGQVANISASRWAGFVIPRRRMPNMLALALVLLTAAAVFASLTYYTVWVAFWQLHPITSSSIATVTNPVQKDTVA